MITEEQTSENIKEINFTKLKWQNRTRSGREDIKVSFHSESPTKERIS